MTGEQIILPASDPDLLAECDVETFRARGPGGQYVNTTDSAVRLRHRPSGVTVTARESRSQHRNKQTCLDRLREKVDELNYRPPTRRPTKISRGAKRRIVENKRRHSDKKRLRSKPPDTSD